MWAAEVRYVGAFIRLSTNSGGSYSILREQYGHINNDNSCTTTVVTSNYLDVTDTSTTRIKFSVAAENNSTLNGGSYGTSGQVLTSQGNATAPTWTNPAGGAWNEINDITLSGTGTSNYQNFSLSQDTWYRFTFTGFYWYGSQDYLGFRLSSNSGGGWDKMYGVRGQLSSYAGLTYWNNSTVNNSNVGYISYSYLSTSYHHTIDMYLYTKANGGASVWGNIWSKDGSYNQEQKFAYATGVNSAGNSSYSTNYIRFRPIVNTNNHTQGMRGRLRIQTWS